MLLYLGTGISCYVEERFFMLLYSGVVLTMR